MKTTLEPNKVIKMAVDGHTDEVALKLGKSAAYIYKMEAEPESCRYTRLLQLYYALPHEGQELLFQDFRARHRANKQVRALKSIDWADAIGDVAKETAEAIVAAVHNRSREDIVKEAVEAIRSLQLLLDIAQANEVKV